MVYKFQPHSTDKNLGAEYNAHCYMVPNDNDWILIMDSDAMLMHSIEAHKIIKLAIARYPNTDIFGAYTNRCGLNYMIPGEEMDPSTDMKWHHLKALAYEMKYADGEAENIPVVPGYFMLFKKSYWKYNHFQKDIINEQGKTFDKVFCMNANNMKCIKGVYVFHQYRMFNDSVFSMDHLKK